MKFVAYKLEDLIYLVTCPKNATHIINTSTELIVDVMNFLFWDKIINRN